MKISVMLPSIVYKNGHALRELELPSPATVHAAIEALSRQLGPSFTDDAIRKNGTVDPMIAILVIGQNVVSLDGLATRLEDGDQLEIMHIVAGGD